MGEVLKVTFPEALVLWNTSTILPDVLETIISGFPSRSKSFTSILLAVRIFPIASLGKVKSGMAEFEPILENEKLPTQLLSFLNTNTPLLLVPP